MHRKEEIANIQPINLLISRMVRCRPSETIRSKSATEWRFVRALQASQKMLFSGRIPKNHTSGAKAQRSGCGVFGMTEVMP
jgi:hypothetical protein